ncbi:putative gamma-glutamylcyclotransferase At3g02910 [Mercurialis annua]|uniref:putative gamma-glutamylcyclotransferase At3g02910 n=1 Tax=Mercurialis annua TaxID=3986 RepID=UPI00215E1B9F|nr:putative gamma-glutamylcyclotransferase At3g02910 [Mercurialis annua]
MGVGKDSPSTATTTLIFTYGTLKKGFSNHVLMQDLMRSGDAVFKGTHRTVDKFPLVCGPYRVPFLLNFPGATGSQRVTGELYAVTPRGLARLDELEGINRCHYERLPITVAEAAMKERDDGEEAAVEVEAYFAHKSYATEMWKRNGKRGYGGYGEKEAKGYVKRKDRPQNLSFLEQIEIFVSSSPIDANC